MRLPSSAILRRSCLALSFAAAPICAGAATADDVTGVVINPETNTPVAGAQVAFLLSGEEGLNELFRKSADSEGRFSFSGPFLNAGIRFVLVAFHDGVAYPSSPLEVGAQKQILLEVFEPTDDDSAVRIRNHHLFFALHADHCEVSQLLHVENTGDATYAGAMSGGERRVTEFFLPSGVFGLESHSGEMTDLDAQRIAHTQPLVPGATQIAFTYRLDAARFDGDYLHVSPFATDLLDIYVQPADIELDAPFADMGEIDLHGQTYRNYRFENLTSRQRLEIELPLSQSWRWALKWAGLVLALCGSVAVVAISRPWRATHPPGKYNRLNRAELEDRRQEVLAALSELEEPDSAAAGSAQRSEHHHLLNQAVEIYLLLDEHPGKGARSS